jgi:hypothetical protein
MEWTRQGGFLYLGAGAAERNQYNEPLAALDGIGLKREPFVFKEVPGHEEQLPGMQVAAKATFGDRTFDVVGGYQVLATSAAGRLWMQFAGTNAAPCATEIAVGQGRVVYVGFFPGTSYVRGGCIGMKAERDRMKQEGKPLVTWNPRSYPLDYHELFRALLEPVRWQPPVRVSHYLVEGSLLEGPDGAVLALANWSGEPQRVEVSIDCAARPGRPRAVVQRLHNLRITPRRVTFSLEVGRGDLVVLPTKP